jgi:hypothetical protein
MLARSARSAHICLRCQTRLSRRLKVPKRSFTTTPKDGEFENPSEPESRPSTIAKGERASHPLRSSSRCLLGRVYGNRGYEKREHLEQLNGVTTLGQPAGVIVLKDAQFEYSEPRARSEYIPPTDEVNRIDIAAAVKAEHGLVPQNQVDRNIEDHRPQNPLEPISQKEFHSLCRQLDEGFTLNQLQKYIVRYERTHGAGNAAQALEQEGTVRNESIIRRTAWMPERSESGEAFEESYMRGYEPEKVVVNGRAISAATRKQIAAIRVLRECWQVDVQEVVESVGEIEFEVGPIEFKLLLGMYDTDTSFV